MHLAVFGNLASGLEQLQQMREGADWCACEDVTGFEDQPDSFFRRIDAAILAADDASVMNESGPERAARDRQLDLLRRHRVGVLILSPQPWRFVGYGFGTVSLPLNSPIETIRGVLLAISRSRPVMRLIDNQVHSIRRMSETLSRQLEETNSDLRLAARLQTEFLPHDLPQAGPLRFATLFRPAAWVSGDIFDIFRLDEIHWGVYLADAVGHGVAAGLLTMYIKQAIRPKRVFQNAYELVPPAEVLSALSDQLASQALRDSQFVTGWYATVNTATLEMKYAVAGHPPALLIEAGGAIRELHGDGCMLGLSAGQQFTSESVQLRHGDRVMVYSDGLEPTLIADRPRLPDMPLLTEGMPALLRLPAGELMAALQKRLDAVPGSLSRADDVSVVIMDVA
ncbi:MAG TPA: PP2C family protein-serine/threonine phosphatase [Phycisphaerae bacterium]|nr:PP2C family protein-serine/threonine phosphatase [Phycisphaerae bacterium]